MSSGAPVAAIEGLWATSATSGEGLSRFRSVCHHATCYNGVGEREVTWPVKRAITMSISLSARLTRLLFRRAFAINLSLILNYHFLGRKLIQKGKHQEERNLQDYKVLTIGYSNVVMAASWNSDCTTETTTQRDHRLQQAAPHTFDEAYKNKLVLSVSCDSR